jgi:uncharacterized protein (UPF0147 family)
VARRRRFDESKVNRDERGRFDEKTGGGFVQALSDQIGQKRGGDSLPGVFKPRKGDTVRVDGKKATYDGLGSNDRVFVIDDSHKRRSVKRDRVMHGTDDVPMAGTGRDDVKPGDYDRQRVQSRGPDRSGAPMPTSPGDGEQLRAEMASKSPAQLRAIANDPNAPARRKTFARQAMAERRIPAEGPAGDIGEMSPSERGRFLRSTKLEDVLSPPPPDKRNPERARRDAYNEEIMDEAVAADGVNLDDGESDDDLAGLIRDFNNSDDPDRRDKLADETRRYLLANGYTDESDLPDPPARRVGPGVTMEKIDHKSEASGTTADRETFVLDMLGEGNGYLDEHDEDDETDPDEDLIGLVNDIEDEMGGGRTRGDRALALAKEMRRYLIANGYTDAGDLTDFDDAGDGLSLETTNDVTLAKIANDISLPAKRRAAAQAEIKRRNQKERQSSQGFAKKLSDDIGTRRGGEPEPVRMGRDFRAPDISAGRASDPSPDAATVQLGPSTYVPINNMPDYKLRQVESRTLQRALNTPEVTDSRKAQIRTELASRGFTPDELKGFSPGNAAPYEPHNPNTPLQPRLAEIWGKADRTKLRRAETVTLKKALLSPEISDTKKAMIRQVLAERGKL